MGNFQELHDRCPWVVAEASWLLAGLDPCSTRSQQIDPQAIGSQGSHGTQSSGMRAAGLEQLVVSI